MLARSTMRHMVLHAAAAAGLALGAMPAPAAPGPWPEPKAPAIPAGRGYRPIPNVAEDVDVTRSYKALFDATKAAPAPKDRLPVLERVSLVLNGLALSNMPKDKIDLAVIFHGPSVDALLNDAAYRRKHNTANPNLELLSQLQKAGVRILVCGQYVAGANVNVAEFVPGVQVAAGATLVMIKLANAGYAVIPD